MSLHRPRPQQVLPFQVRLEKIANSVTGKQPAAVPVHAPALKLDLVDGFADPLVIKANVSTAKITLPLPMTHIEPVRSFRKLCSREPLQIPRAKWFSFLETDLCPPASAGIELDGFSAPQTTIANLLSEPVSSFSKPLKLIKSKALSSQVSINIIRTAVSYHSNIGLLRQIPVRRGRESTLSTSRLTAEKERLAETANIPLLDIAWIGLFRLVPIAAASSIGIDERRGILSIFFKPDAADIVQDAHSPVVNLALGRVRSTGAIVHTVAE